MEETTSLPLRKETGEIVYQDRNQTIRRVLAYFEGFEKEYFVSDHGERAAMLAVRGDSVLFARQYRLLVDGISLEIPGGRVNPGERPDEAAVRECLEETGVRCSHPRRILAFHPGLDITLNYTHVFLSEECTVEKEMPDDKLMWLPLRRSVHMVFSGEIRDALSVCAILGLQCHRMGFSS